MNVSTHLSRRAALAVAAVTLVGVLPAVVGSVSAQAAGRPAHVFVDPRVHVGNDIDVSCATAAYRHIQSAVDAVQTGGTVTVCRGVYHADVSVTRRLRLIGFGAVINAAGKDNGIVVTTSHVTVTGFTIRDAIGEGILLGHLPTATPKIQVVRFETVNHNIIIDNDRQFALPTSHYLECTPNAGADCGEALHLLSVKDSAITHNVIDDNAGGILLTDESGPTAHNLVAENTVRNNTKDCGITLASHSANATSFSLATFQATTRHPGAAGVYSNDIRDNISTGNGVKGDGAGVLMGVPEPGSAVYNNTIEGNHVSGNGLSGITIHQHYPGLSYAGGNRLIGNFIGRNNVDGDTLDGNTVSDPATTGILVYTAGTITMTIRGNHISNDQIGIWRTPDVTVTGLAANSYSAVPTHVFTVTTPIAATLAPGEGPLPPAGSTTATLFGTLNPDGTVTSYFFEYATNALLTGAIDTSPVTAGSGTAEEFVHAPVNSLTASTVYYVQLVATYGASQQSIGGIASFTTAA